MEYEQHSGVLDVNEPSATNWDATSEQGNSSSDWPSKDPSSSYDNIVRNKANSSIGDIVRKKVTAFIGVVTEVAGKSDSDSSMTDDVDEEDDGKDDEVGSNEEGDAANNNYKQIPLTADLVRVLWMDGTETTEGTNNVETVDRQFFLGGYVASAYDPTGQIGVVVDVNIDVDLLAHDGSVLKGKPSKELRRIRNFTVGDHVVLGPWLGKIKQVLDNVTVQLDDGSICKVMKADPKHLKQVGQYNVHFPYSVGERVKDTTSDVFKNATWLSGSWKANHLEGTVTKVSAVSVYINWIVSDGCGPDSFTLPAEEQSPKNLKLLSCFLHTEWMLCQCCLLNKGLLKLDSNDSAQDERESNETDDEFYEEVITAEEYVDTKLMENISEASLSKNAETSDNNSSAERLCNSSVLASKEVVHETWHIHRKKILKVVVTEDKKSRKKTESFERAFLIVNTHSKVDVAWQDGNLNRGLDSISLIRIDSPGDHEFVAENYVLEKGADNEDGIETRRVGVVKSVNAKDQTAFVKWLKPAARREFDKEEFVSVYELGRHHDYNYTYGDFVVRLPPISSPESSPGHDMSTEFSELAWVGNITGLKDGDIEVTWAEGMISTVDPQAVYVYPRNDDGSSASGSESSGSAEDDMVNVDNAEYTGSEIESDLLEAETLCNFKLPRSDAPALEEFNFEVFDIVRDPIDHYFLGTEGQNNAARKWLKKVQQDWAILQNDLPEGIYVRVYEDRMDLLRAAIVGAYGTPYQDGVFFFDFLLPPEYPNVAPSVYYHSGGWKINPNLYEDGKVCLSLLNTWKGRGNEVWDSSTSSILQVLVSLQGLVLNSKPYFNEHGYDKQVGTVEGEKKSLSYNENTFLLHCKKIIHEIRKPPKDFEQLVTKHYKKRGYYILKACDAYMNGHLVGSLGKDASPREDISSDSNSMGFKLLLRKIVANLFSALTTVGADCEFWRDRCL